ncbi:MAG: hypothetical protein ACKPJJ_06875, partial [Planctomycetaceae bacterium]
SPLSDSHIAPGDHPSGPLRMSKKTQLRPLSSFGKNEIWLRRDGGVRMVEVICFGPNDASGIGFQSAT